jgi:DNA end-binding protein Ku
VKITKDMLDLAKHIVEQKSGHFEPGKFEDHHEAALTELLNKKQKGVPITVAKKQTPNNVVNLMDALRASIGDKGKRAGAAAKRTKASAKKAAKSKKSA